MGLTGSLMIGQSALAASQVALQVTGNNIANAATPGYSRQRIGLEPLRGQAFTNGSFLGRGVSVGEIKRLVEPSVLARLRSSIAQEQSASVSFGVMQQLESITAELGDSGLTSQLQLFFNAFSELANAPDQAGMKALAVEQGASLAASIRDMRLALDAQRVFVGQQLEAVVLQADGLMESIASLNQTLVNVEQGSGEDGNLRDQRDVLLDELAGLMEITVIEQDSGAVDVLVGSQPVVLGAESRGLRLRETAEAGSSTLDIVTVFPEEEVIQVGAGRIGGLLEQRESAIDETIADLDAVTSQLIFEVNKLHALGRPSVPLTALTSERLFPAPDRVLALNDPANETMAGLPFGPVNGSFGVTITDANGNTSTQTILVDLDGVDASGAKGFGDDATVEDLAAQLDAIANLNASVGPDGALQITTDAGFEVSFADDTSGVLAALGVNSYFTGVDARDVGVRQALIDEPGLLVVGVEPGANQTALAIAGLDDEPVAGLGGDSIRGAWARRIEANGVRTASASASVDSLSTVRQSLETQRAAISGVSMDEESINLITFQQQYQGAARFISVVNDLTQTLLGLV